MAKIKSHTDLSQSKKLAEILPHESADMWFVNGIVIARDSANDPDDIKSVFPCWSLAALLGVLPDYTLQDNPDGTVFVVSEKEKPIMSDDYDNPVDACYEMILKLHELNEFITWKEKKSKRK